MGDLNPGQEHPYLTIGRFMQELRHNVHKMHLLSEESLPDAYLDIENLRLKQILKNVGTKVKLLNNNSNNSNRNDASFRSTTELNPNSSSPQVHQSPNNINTSLLSTPSTEYDYNSVSTPRIRGANVVTPDDTQMDVSNEKLSGKGGNNLGSDFSKEGNAEKNMIQGSTLVASEMKWLYDYNISLQEEIKKLRQHISSNENISSRSNDQRIQELTRDNKELRDALSQASSVNMLHSMNDAKIQSLKNEIKDLQDSLFQASKWKDRAVELEKRCNELEKNNLLIHKDVDSLNSRKENLESEAYDIERILETLSFGRHLSVVDSVKTLKTHFCESQDKVSALQKEVSELSRKAEEDSEAFQVVLSSYNEIISRFSNFTPIPLGSSQKSRHLLRSHEENMNGVQAFFKVVDTSDKNLKRLANENRNIRDNLRKLHQRWTEINAQTKQELRSARREVESLQNDYNKDLRGISDTFRSRINQYLSSQKAAKSEMKQAYKELVQEKETVEFNHEKLIEKLEKKLRKLESENVGLKEQLDHLKYSFAASQREFEVEMKARSSRSSEELDLLSKEVSLAKQSLESLRQEKTMLSERNINHLKALMSLNDSLTESNANKNDIFGSIVPSSISLTELDALWNKKLQTFSSSLNSLVYEKRNLEKLLLAAEDSLEHMEKELRLSRDQNVSLVSEIQTLKRNSSNLLNERKDFEIEVLDSKNQLSSAQQELNLMKITSETIQSKYDQLSHEVSFLKKSNLKYQQDLDEQKRYLQNSYDKELKKLKSSYEESLESIESRLDVFRKEALEARGQFGALIDSHNQKNSQYESRIQELLQENDLFKQRNERLHEQMNDNCLSLNRLLDDTSNSVDFEKSLSAFSKMIASLRSDNKSKDISLMNSQLAVDQLKEELSQLTERVSNLCHRFKQKEGDYVRSIENMEEKVQKYSDELDLMIQERQQDRSFMEIYLGLRSGDDWRLILPQIIENRDDLACQLEEAKDQLLLEKESICMLWDQWTSFVKSLDSDILFEDLDSMSCTIPAMMVSMFPWLHQKFSEVTNAEHDKALSYQHRNEKLMEINSRIAVDLDRYRTSIEGLYSKLTKIYGMNERSSLTYENKLDTCLEFVLKQLSERKNEKKRVDIVSLQHQDEIGNLQARILSLEKKEKEMLVKISMDGTLTDHLNKQIEELKLENQLLDSKIQQNDSAYQELLVQSACLKEELSRQSEYLACSNIQLASLEDTRSRLAQTIDEKELIISGLEKELEKRKTYENDYLEVSKHWEDCKAQIASLESRMVTLNETIISKEAQITEIVEENANLKYSKAALEENHSQHIEKMNEEHNMKLEEMKAMLATRIENESKMKNEISNRDSRLEIASQELLTSEIKLKEVEDKLMGVSLDNEKLLESNEQLQKYCSSLVAQNSTLEVRFVNIDQSHTNSISRIEKLSDLLVSKNKELELVEQQLSWSQEHLESERLRFADTSRSLEQVQTAFAEKCDAFNRLKEEITRKEILLQSQANDLGVKTELIDRQTQLANYYKNLYDDLVLRTSENYKEIDEIKATYRTENELLEMEFEDRRSGLLLGVEAIQSRLDSLSNEWELLSHRNSFLEENNDYLSRRIDELTIENNDLAEKLSSSSEEVIRCENKLMEEVAAKEESFSKLEGKIIEVDKLYSKLQEIDELLICEKNISSSLRITTSNFKEECSRLSGEVIAAQNHSLTLENKLQGAEQSIEALLDEKYKLEDEKKDISDKYDVLKTSAEVYQTDIENLNNRLLECQSQLSDKNTSYDQIVIQNESLFSENTELRREVDSTLIRHESVIASMSEEHEKLVANLQQKISMQEITTKELEENVDRIRNDYFEVSKEAKVVSDSLTASLARESIYVSQIEDLQMRLDKLDLENKEKNKELYTISERCDIVVEEKNALNQRIEDELLKRIELAVQFMASKDELLEKEKSLSSLQLNYERISKEKQDLQFLFEEKCNDFAALNERHREILSKLDRVSSDLDASIRSQESLESINSSTSLELQQLKTVLLDSERNLTEKCNQLSELEAKYSSVCSTVEEQQNTIDGLMARKHDLFRELDRTNGVVEVLSKNELKMASKCSEILQSLEDCKAQITSLESRNVTLNETIIFKEAQITEIVEENENLKYSKAVLEENHSQHIEKMNEEHNMKLEEMKAMLATRIENESKMKNEISNRDSRLEIASQELLTSEIKLKEVEDKLMGVSLDNEKLLESNEQLQEYCYHIDQENKEIRNSSADLMEQYDKVVLELDEQRSLLTSQREHSDDLACELRGMEHWVSFMIRKSSLSSFFLKWKSSWQRHKLEENIQALHDELEESESNCSQIKDLFEIREVEHLSNLESFQAEILSNRELLEANESLVRNVADLEEQRKQWFVREHSYIVTIEGMKKDTEFRLQNTVRRITDDCSEICADNAACYVKDYKHLEDEVMELREINNELEGRNKKFECEVSRLTQNLAHIRESLCSAEIFSHSNIEQVINNHLGSFDNRLSKLTSQIVSLRDALSSSRKDAMTMKERLLQMNVDNENLLIEREGLNEQILGCKDIVMSLLDTSRCKQKNLNVNSCSITDLHFELQQQLEEESKRKSEILESLRTQLKEALLLSCSMPRKEDSIDDESDDIDSMEKSSLDAFEEISLQLMCLCDDAVVNDDPNCSISSSRLIPFSSAMKSLKHLNHCHNKALKRCNRQKDEIKRLSNEISSLQSERVGIKNNCDTLIEQKTLLWKKLTSMIENYCEKRYCEINFADHNNDFIFGGLDYLDATFSGLIKQLCSYESELSDMKSSLATVEASRNETLKEFAEFSQRNQEQLSLLQNFERSDVQLRKEVNRCIKERSHLTDKIALLEENVKNTLELNKKSNSCCEMLRSKLEETNKCHSDEVLNLQSKVLSLSEQCNDILEQRNHFKSKYESLKIRLQSFGVKHIATNYQ